MKLSIAIPTFNRPHVIRRILNDFLSLKLSDQNKLSFVIHDNNSNKDVKNSDDYSFIEELANRNDKISLYSSAKTVSAPENYLKAIGLCQTEYILFSTDKDYLNLHAVLEIWKILKNLSSNPDCVFVENNQNSSNTITNRYKYLYKRAFQSPHPTGYVLQKKSFNRYLENLHSNSLRSSPFVMDFFDLHSALKSQGKVFVKSNLYLPESNIEVDQIKSFSYLSSADYYFSYKNRLALVKQYYNVIDRQTHYNPFLRIFCRILLFYRLQVQMNIWLPRMLEQPHFVSHYNIQASDDLFLYDIVENFKFEKYLSYSISKFLFKLRFRK